MSFPLQIGDLVRLKSGGQIMTVHNLTGNDKVSCIWHDCDGRFQEATIDKRALSKASQIGLSGAGSRKVS